MICTLKKWMNKIVLSTHPWATANVICASLKMSFSGAKKGIPLASNNTSLEVKCISDEYGLSPKTIQKITKKIKKQWITGDQGKERFQRDDSKRNNRSRYCASWLRLSRKELKKEWDCDLWGFYWGFSDIDTSHPETLSSILLDSHVVERVLFYKHGI